METAMKMFINAAKQLRELNHNQDLIPTKYYQETLLAKEKQQIIDSFTAGQIDIFDAFLNEFKERGFTYDKVFPENDNEDGEEYFVKTFSN